MKTLKLLLVLLMLTKFSNSTTIIPMDAIAQVAKRFWTTLATVAIEKTQLDDDLDDELEIDRSKHILATENSNKPEKLVNDDVELIDSNIEIATTVTPNVASNSGTSRNKGPRRKLATGRRALKTSLSNATPTKQHTTKAPSPLTTATPTIKPTTTCDKTTTPTTSKNFPLSELEQDEEFAITQFPHALATTSKTPAPKLSTIATTNITATIASTIKPKSVTSLPIIESTSSEAVMSLIKAITTAMDLVSDTLESKLQSVTVHRDDDVEESETIAVVNPEIVQNNSPKAAALINPKTRTQTIQSPKRPVVDSLVDDVNDNTRLQPTSTIRPPIKNTTEESGECFFEVSDQSDMCNWTYSSTSSIKWSFGLGETAYMQGGPIKDSNGRIFGGYAFIDTSAGAVANSVEIQRAELISPELQQTSHTGRCLTFWYNIGGLSAERLRILLISEEEFATRQTNRAPQYSLLWERKDTTNSSWIKSEILYTFSKPHRLIFEGFARAGNDYRRKFQGFIAVDDVAMDSDSCIAFCTFEGLLCGWENEDGPDNFNWELGRGSMSHLTGPVRDHGDGPEGGYMYIDSSYPQRPGDVARLKSPTLAPTSDGPLCFRFWTHMYGNGIGTLRVLQQTDSEEKVIWEVSGESGNTWHMAQVTAASQNEYKIILESVVGLNFLGNIAIDDISFGPGPCPSSPQTALPSRGDCTFEADECGWINAGSGDQYDWLRISPNQPIPSGNSNPNYKPPEPVSDHTVGLSSGHILTMERSSVPPRAGDQAYIVGPILQGSPSGKCFSFHTYMHERVIDNSGPGLGSLRIYLRTGNSAILKPIWRLINYEHPEWFFSQTPIETSEKFQIVIAGTWGSTRQGAIAVDDLTFYDGNCSVVPNEAKVTPGECTFDSNMCEWTTVPDINKELSTWQLASSNRRPSNLNDHTYRATSGYAFYDIFSQQPHLVRLESPELKPSDNSSEEDSAERCLTFWFTPFGNSNRNSFLRIIQKDLDFGHESVVWDVTAANFAMFKPEWIFGQVAVSNNATHKIIFEGSSNNGGFAVDDITFAPGGCESRPGKH
ncbi:hypothetical protein CHUAL_001893 [Chamberlinius hualienensis]